MRNLHLPYGLMLCLFFCSPVFAQHQCGTQVTAENIAYSQATWEKWKEFKHNFIANASDRMEAVVPIQFHVVRNNFGGGIGLSESEVLSLVNKPNAFFSQIDIQFQACGDVNYIDSSNLTDYDISNPQEEIQLTAPNNKPNVLNVYIVDKLKAIQQGKEITVRGLARMADESRFFVILGQNYATNNSTFVHELGHVFGLWHTHHSSNHPLNFVARERVTRVPGMANCETAGDLLCDTPADPGFYAHDDLDPGQVTVHQESCTYLGHNNPNEVDPMDQQYQPQTTNIMSYSWDNCRTVFTQEQYMRMRFFYDEHMFTYSCGNVPSDGGINPGNGNTGGGGNNPNPPNTPNPAAPYCESVATEGGGGYISGVKISNVNNLTGDDGGYGDFLNRIVDLNQAGQYEIRLTPKLNVFASSGWKAWIDFNQSETFEPNEIIASVDHAGFTSLPYVGDVNIPEDAKIGMTRMRVIYGVGSSPTDCGKYVRGETEDYSVNIMDKIVPDVCNPTGGNTFVAWIKRVQLNSLDNETGNDGGRADYSANPAQVTQGNTYPLTVTQGDQTGYPKSWKVWIDLNQDKDFEDAGELVMTGNTNWSSPSLTRDITFPNNVLGEMDMRVAMGIFAGPTTPCADISYGDIENYKIIAGKGYCNVSGANTTYEWIDKVVIRTSNNTDFENQSGNNDGYGNFTDRTVTLTQNVLYPFQLIPGFSATAYPENWTIWADLNIDGDFDDPGEALYRTPAQGFSETVSGQIIIPVTAMTGTTRMRIIMNWANASHGPFPSTSCEAFNDGEVEDYTLEILPEFGMPDGFLIPGFSEISEANIKGEPSVKPREGFQMNLYPNPTGGFVNVEMQLNLSREAEINVYSVTGILQKTIFVEETQVIDYQLDLNDLARGTYMIQVKGRDFSVTKRLIILK